ASCCFTFVFSWSTDLQHLHSFPTRRSSDLARLPDQSRVQRPFTPERCALDGTFRESRFSGQPVFHLPRRRVVPRQEVHGLRQSRSEEHTSELQSPYDLVCRLLLEKKKKKST